MDLEFGSWHSVGTAASPPGPPATRAATRKACCP